MASLAEILAKFGVRSKMKEREDSSPSNMLNEASEGPLERSERDYAPLARMFGSSVKGALTLPQRIMEASEERRTGGDYNAAPAAELMANLYGLNAPFAQLGAAGAFGGKIRAYHGSPYDFEKFDLSKIGTGEGAQSYGHGLYFAENPKVAEDYRRRLSQVAPDTVIDNALNRLRTNRGSYQEALRDIDDRILHSEAYGDSPQTLATLKQERDILANEWKPSTGRMYEVDINANPESMLQWDKPLASNDPVRQVAAEALPKNPWWRMDEPERTLRSVDKERFLADPELTGERLYGALSGRLGRGEFDQAKASNVLREAGIPGIRYLDQGSREVGQGTSNYVIFDPSIVDIVKKYGLGALGVMGGVGAMGQKGEASERNESFDQINQLQEAQLRKLGESALKRGLSDAEPTYRMLADLLSGRTEGYSPEQLAHAKEIFREVSESEESKKLRAASEALRTKSNPIQELLKRNELPDPRYRAPGYFPRKDILMGRLSPEETQIGPQSSPNSLGTQLAMADDPASRTKPLFEVGGGRGGGFSGGNPVPVRDTSSLVPAIKHPLTNKMYYGKPGETHDDVIRQNLEKKVINKYVNSSYRGVGTGFYDKTAKKFIPSEDVNLDSTDLFSEKQLFNRQFRKAFDE